MLRKERTRLKFFLIKEEEFTYIGKSVVLQEEEVYQVYSGQGIAEGMCGERMVWYYYVLQC